MSPVFAQEYTSSMRRIRQSLRRGDIMIVDDESSIRDYLKALCDALGINAIKFSDKKVAKFHILVNHSEVKLAIVDYMLEDGPSDDLISLCREYNIPCLIHTGRADLVKTLQERYPELITILKTCPVERLIKELL